MDSTKILIQLNNASFTYQEDEYLFENVKLTVKEGDKTAIVGANGSGKSTLLKLLTGSLPLENGSRIIDCKSYYVPQIDLNSHQKNSKIYEYISDFYEDWWEVLPELEKLFGLYIDSEALTKTLSGGELMKLNLAIAIKHNPDVLILDEPTNHLDINSINTLIRFINVDTKNKYTYVIVSHDIFFLDQVVTAIWELENKQITVYGGNYTFYREQKELHLRGIRRQFEIAEQKLERANQLEQKEEEKLAKRANEAKRAFMKGSLDKDSYSKGKDAASSLQHNKSNVLEKLKDEAAQKLEEYETEERKLAFMGIRNTTGNANRTIFELKDATLKVKDATLIKDLNLRVTYGDRIVISGNNGVGKTSLIKALIKQTLEKHKDIVNDETRLEGEVTSGKKLDCVYIDQHYTMIKPDLNLVENLMAYDPSITESKAKEQLGKFKFKTEMEMLKLGKNLSGGEMVRLIMSMATSFPIDLIILDEPTNNLDVETVEVLIKSLNMFRGAIVVISHNMDFLNKINIKTAFLIKNKVLKQISIEPGNSETLYKAITA